MQTKRLTKLAKGLILGFAAVAIITVMYFTGVFSNLISNTNVEKFVSNVGTSNDSKGTNSSDSKGTSKSNEINISLDEWIGWKSIIDANGGLTTQPGSIYDKMGLKIKINVINDATQSSNALIKGELDGAGYTVNRYAFLYPKFKENNVPVTMSYITNSSTGGDGIISKANIKGIEDLVGKKIAVPRYSEAQTLVWWLLSKSNLNADQIKQIEKNMVMFDTPDDAAKAFFAGQVDAAATWQPYLSQAQETTGAKLLFSTKSAHSIILDGIVFRKDFLDNNKETVAKFIEGSLQAEKLYTTEFDAIKNTMPLFSTETNENIKAMSADATLSNYFDNIELLDKTAKTLFIDMSDIWNRLGEKSSPNEVDNAFDTSAIKMLDGKFEKAINNAPKVSEKQRQSAKNVDSLLKKSVSIEFAPNSATFVDSEKAGKSLKEFVEISKILDGAIIQIEGNISNTGVNDVEAGKKLSYMRAKTVAEFLKYQGVDPSRFIIVGNGISKQIGDNKTEEGRKLNRRTDIMFKMVE